jgi:hypothetical protein
MICLLNFNFILSVIFCTRICVTFCVVKWNDVNIHTFTDARQWGKRCCLNRYIKFHNQTFTSLSVILCLLIPLLPSICFTSTQSSLWNKKKDREREMLEGCLHFMCKHALFFALQISRFLFFFFSIMLVSFFRYIYIYYFHANNKAGVERWWN